MSTKIFNAYKFNGTMQDLFDHCRSSREVWLDDQVERLIPFAKEDYDSGEFKSVGDVYRIIRDNTKAQTESPYSMYGGISIFLYKNKIFVQLFNCLDSFQDDRFEDFHYQNQTDAWHDYEFFEGKMSKSDHIKAERNYKYRKKVWDVIYDKHSNPEQAGFKYDFGFSDSDALYVSRKVIAVIWPKE